jgi:transcription initiation factor TFIIIB Brf1 subunit/transcription initiation factor TFIIB
VDIGEGRYLVCERCGSDRLKIIIRHQEAETILCAKCDDVVAYANGLTRVSLEAKKSEHQ